MSFTPALLSLCVELSKDNAVLHCVRAKNGTLVSLSPSSEQPELAKGQTFGLFVPTEVEQAFLDLAMPKTVVKVDPMVNRLRKSEVERPVQFVLRVVRENPSLERKDLIALCVNMGVADYTARTQVQVGLKRRKALAALFAQASQEQTEETTEDQGE